MTERKNDLRLPWKIGDYGKFVYRVLPDVFHNEAYYPDAPCVDTAAFIVKAVNSHDALVAMVRELRDHCEYSDVRNQAYELLASLNLD